MDSKATATFGKDEVLEFWNEKRMGRIMEFPLMVKIGQGEDPSRPIYIETYTSGNYNANYRGALSTVGFTAEYTRRLACAINRTRLKNRIEPASRLDRDVFLVNSDTQSFNIASPETLSDQQKDSDFKLVLKTATAVAKELTQEYQQSPNAFAANMRENKTIIRAWMEKHNIVTLVTDTQLEDLKRQLTRYTPRFSDKEDIFSEWLKANDIKIPKSVRNDIGALISDLNRAEERAMRR